MPYTEEGVGDFEAYINGMLARLQSRIWTALPGVVNTWNYPSNGNNTVSAVPGIMQQKLHPDGKWIAEPMLAHEDVPVHFMGGGGFYLTHPIGQGDEGILLYAARALDTWWQQGGTQARPSYGLNRMHDLSDAMFIPTRMSDKNKLASISQTSTQLRSIDGRSFIEMLPNGAGMNFVTPGQYLRFVGSTGNLHVSGNVFWNDNTAATDAVGHKHGQVTTGSDQTGVPVPGT